MVLRRVSLLMLARVVCRSSTTTRTTGFTPITDHGDPSHFPDAMSLTMTAYTKGHAVINRQAQGRVVGEGQDVVCVQATAPQTAVGAAVVVARKHRRAPLQVGYATANFLRGREGSAPPTRVAIPDYVWPGASHLGARRERDSWVRVLGSATEWRGLAILEACRQANLRCEVSHHPAPSEVSETVLIQKLTNPSPTATHFAADLRTGLAEYNVVLYQELAAKNVAESLVDIVPLHEPTRLSGDVSTGAVGLFGDRRGLATTALAECHGHLGLGLTEPRKYNPHGAWRGVTLS